jgi:hypothetical protein
MHWKFKWWSLGQQTLMGMIELKNTELIISEKLIHMQRLYSKKLQY